LAVNPRRTLAAGAALTVVGLVAAATAPPHNPPPSGAGLSQTAVGGAIVLIGWMVLAWGIHRLGRDGADV
jgi:hypothetical protein